MMSLKRLYPIPFLRKLQFTSRYLSLCQQDFFQYVVPKRCLGFALQIPVSLANGISPGPQARPGTVGLPCPRHPYHSHTTQGILGMGVSYGWLGVPLVRTSLEFPVKHLDDKYKVHLEFTVPFNLHFP